VPSKNSGNSGKSGKTPGKMIAAVMPLQDLPPGEAQGIALPRS